MLPRLFTLFWINLSVEITQLASAQSWCDHRPSGLLWLLVLHFQHPASDGTRKMFPRNIPFSTGMGSAVALISWNWTFRCTRIVKQSLEYAILPSSPLGWGVRGFFQEQELVCSSFSSLPAMQMCVTQRLLRKKPIVIVSEYCKQHLMTKYYEINRPQKNRSCWNRFRLCFHVTI